MGCCYSIEPGLIEYCKTGDVDKLNEYIESGYVLNVEDDSGRTELMYTGIHGQNECLQLLIKNSIDVNQVDSTNKTTLNYAIKQHKNNCVKTLLNANASPNCINHGSIPLAVASRSNNVKAVSLLLDANANIDVNCSKGYTQIMMAINNSHKSVKLLIEANADLNQVNDNNTSALIYACKCNDNKSVALLVNARADLNLTDNDNKIALEHASDRCKKFIIQSKILGDEHLELACAIECKDYNSIRALIKRNIRLDKSDIWQAEVYNNTLHKIKKDREIRRPILLKYVSEDICDHIVLKY
jgi:ankyrin repeat protein